MPSSSLISIIMPCYNAGKLIAETIESVLQQTHKEFELIIIDDGSTDNSKEIISSFNDERIKYFAQPNAGQCKASNFGISVSKGDFIKFLDADDIINSKHLELQLTRIKDHPDCIASCEWGRFYDDDFSSAVFNPESVWKDLPGLTWLKMSLSQKYDMMGAWLWLIPRAILEKAGGWDERLSLNNDFEFSIRLLLNADKVLFAEGAKIYYRSGGAGTLSKIQTEKYYEAAYLSTHLGCSHLLKADNSPEMKRLCADRYKEWLFVIWPQFLSVTNKIEAEIKNLGGSNRMPAGGTALSILQSVFGWKAAKRIRQFFYKKGYRPKAANK